jgi:hypothetical protein
MKALSRGVPAHPADLEVELVNVLRVGLRQQK